MALVIRSMRIKNQQVFIRAGAGIVAESDAALEYEETQHKTQTCLRALLAVSAREPLSCC